MKKFRPEVINFRMQLGYPDSDVDKCSGQPVLHLIILCSEDEERDYDLLHDEDVQGMKDVACCYYTRTFHGSGFEIMAKLTTVVSEWLINNTHLPVRFGLELLSIIIDKYKDLKDRVETSVYLNNIGMNIHHHVSTRDELLIINREDPDSIYKEPWWDIERTKTVYPKFLNKELEMPKVDIFRKVEDNALSVCTLNTLTKTDLSNLSKIINIKKLGNKKPYLEMNKKFNRRTR